jgi:hypothetical protein
MPLSDDFVNEIENQSQQDFGGFDDIVNKCAVDRLGATEGERQSTNPSDTAKQNYTAIRYGNDHGSISFGHIHEKADVTAAVMLQTPDGRHQLSMDKDGARKGWTTLTAPGNIQIEAGSDNQEAQDTLMINSKNGNILIVASNGKIRLEGTDIELIATGEGGSKGNIRLTASENITTDSKKLLMNASANYRLATPGTGEVISNGVLKMYGSIIQGVTDACAKKIQKLVVKDFKEKIIK